MREIHFQIWGACYPANDEPGFGVPIFELNGSLYTQELVPNLELIQAFHVLGERPIGAVELLERSLPVYSVGWHMAYAYRAVDGSQAAGSRLEVRAFVESRLGEITNRWVRAEADWLMADDITYYDKYDRQKQLSFKTTAMRVRAAKDFAEAQKLIKIARKLIKLPKTERAE